MGMMEIGPVFGSGGCQCHNQQLQQGVQIAKRFQSQKKEPLFNSAFELLRYEQVVLGVTHWVKLREAMR